MYWSFTCAKPFLYTCITIQLITSSRDNLQTTHQLKVFHFRRSFKTANYLIMIIDMNEIYSIAITASFMYRKKAVFNCINIIHFLRYNTFSENYLMKCRLWRQSYLHIAVGNLNAYDMFRISFYREHLLLYVVKCFKFHDFMLVNIIHTIGFPIIFSL